MILHRYRSTQRRVGYKRGPWLGGHWLYLGRWVIYWRTERNDRRRRLLFAQEKARAAGKGSGIGSGRIYPPRPW